jgi:hypothetical protein
LNYGDKALDYDDYWRVYYPRTLEAYSYEKEQDHWQKALQRMPRTAFAARSLKPVDIEVLKITAWRLPI